MRAELRRSVEVEVPAEVLWARVTDWSRQGEWIPFTRTEVVTGTGRQVGDRVRAWTGLGPVGFRDPMTITAWEEDRGGGRCEVLHTGRVVRGEGQFAVTGTGPRRSRFDWWERVLVPGGPLGAVAWRLVGPAAGWGLGRGLRRVAARLEQDHA